MSDSSGIFIGFEPVSDNGYNNTVRITRQMPRRDTEDKQHFTARRRASRCQTADVSREL